MALGLDADNAGLAATSLRLRAARILLANPAVVMLDDPRDLVRPRGVGYPDAGRRAEVLALYRRGQPTASEVADEAQATIAVVGQ